MKHLFEKQRPNRLQRKIVGVIFVIVVVPMLIAGVISASWVTRNFEQSLEGWIREAAQVNEDWLQTLQHNGMLFGNLLIRDLGLEQHPDPATRLHIPSHLEALRKELGLNFVQLYDDDRLVYAAPKMKLLTRWRHGQTQAILKVRNGKKNLLAAVAILRLPRTGEARYHLFIGSLLDREFLLRLSRLSGLKTRLFYPEGSNFAKAFSQSGRPLSVRIPPEAFQQLQERQPYYSDRAENGQYRGLYTPVTDSTGKVEAVMFSGLAAHGIDTILTHKITLSATIAVLGSLIGIVTGLLLSRFVVRPVEYLRDGVLRVASQDFRAKVPVTTDDELGDLARAFNAMAESLRESRDEQSREFRKDKLSAMGELSLALAHEIRNPVGVINTATAMLGKPGQSAEKQADLLRMTREESMRLNGLLRDFQQLARHRAPKLATIDPVAPLERALRAALAEREDVQVRTRLKHRPFTIEADAELLQQAWSNLVNNALQAMGEGPGTLTVSSEVSEGRLLVSLEDSGPGLSVDVIPRLFEPFFTTKDRGTGLGLTIANTLVEANGGQLEVLPSQGGGACFGMGFPLGVTT